MSERRWGSIFALVRQGFSLEREFGARTLGALTSLAELVEESVYDRGSLRVGPSGLAFRLRNPPLRTGAFASLRVAIDGVRIPEEQVEVRGGEGQPWRAAVGIRRDAPLDLRPGQPTEIRVRGSTSTRGSELRVRLELRSVAIPPLVWLEFTDTVGEEEVE